MRIDISTKNMTLDEPLRIFIEEKIGGLDRLIGNDKGQAKVEIGKPSEHHRTGFIYYAEINLKVGSKLFRGVAEHADLHTAVDFARNEIEEQIKKDRTKIRDSHRVSKRV